MPNLLELALKQLDSKDYEARDEVPSNWASEKESSYAQHAQVSGPDAAPSIAADGKEKGDTLRLVDDFESREGRDVLEREQLTSVDFPEPSEPLDRYGA